MLIRDVQDLIQVKWYWFLIVGFVLILCGGAAVVLPNVSTVAASSVLGIALGIGGVVKVVEALQVEEWSGSFWSLLLGATEVVGGILIYLNPMKGALAIALMIAIVFLIQGLMQIALAFRVRPQPGWGWLLLAGIIALMVMVATVLKVRYITGYAAGPIAGLALLVGGVGYVIIAFANRRALLSGAGGSGEQPTS